MYINTNITFHSATAFGPTAWFRDEHPVTIHRRHYHNRQHAAASPRADEPLSSELNSSED